MEGKAETSVQLTNQGIWEKKSKPPLRQMDIALKCSYAETNIAVIPLILANCFVLQCSSTLTNSEGVSN